MTFAFNAYASAWQKDKKQKPSEQQFTAEELEQIERVQIELDGCKKLRKLDETRVGRLNAYIKALEDLNASDDQIIAKLTEANKSRAEIDKLCEERHATVLKLVEELKGQLQRAEASRNFWRRAAGIGVVVGAAIGYVLGGK